jgi:hypothetical protein
MNPIIKNIFAVLAGVFVGSAVNMGLILLGGKLVTAPLGVDVTTTEGLKAGMHLFKPINFLFPFLAHALGTFVGSMATYKFAATHNFSLAMIIGFMFLVGGIMSVFMLPSPLWYTLVDLLFAYLPMAFLGTKIGSKV